MGCGMNKQPGAMQAHRDAMGAVFLDALMTSALAKPEQDFCDTFSDALDVMLRAIDAALRAREGR